MCSTPKIEEEVHITVGRNTFSLPTNRRIFLCYGLQIVYYFFPFTTLQKFKKRTASVKIFSTFIDKQNVI